LVRDNQAVRYDPELSAEGPAPEQAPDAVGRLLAQARVDLGYELAGVAAELRIRLPYLQAIEEARYRDLPGMPYAIGFVRSYAEFVGLDPEATVALFKTEVRDLARAQQQLSFPAPKPEGRLPGGALVLLSLVVVGLAYGGWYLWNESGRPFVEMLPALESEQGGDQGGQLAEAPGEPAGSLAEEEATPAAGGEAAGEEAAEEVAAEAGEEAGAASGEPASPPPASSDVAAAPVIEPAASAEEAGAAAEGEATSAVPAPPQPPEDEEQPGEQTEEPAAAEAPAAESGEEAAEEPEVETAAVSPEEQAAAVTAAGGNGQVYGDEGAGVRVVLVATADSWVQIRGSDDELLFTRVLRPGDSYRVPDQPGLTLLTGNAGGLELVVDGQRLPTLGPQGAVRRDVPLDAEALRSQAN